MAIAVNYRQWLLDNFMKLVRTRRTTQLHLFLFVIQTIVRCYYARLLVALNRVTVRNRNGWKYVDEMKLTIINAKITLRRELFIQMNFNIIAHVF